MLRDNKLIDKLVADLHFHNYLFVETGDNIFVKNESEEIDGINSFISAIGLGGQLDAKTDFFHGGTVLTSRVKSRINEYIDDVSIDTFFRTNKFEEIVFPQGLCYTRYTPNGMERPISDVKININNFYDRCTFANNIWRLFGIDDYLLDIFPNNDFIKSFFINDKVFGLHSSCGVLINEIPFHMELEDYLMNSQNDNHSMPYFTRGDAIIRYADSIRNGFRHNFNNYVLDRMFNFHHSYSKLRDSHIFGNYSIEEILCIYSLLTDKFLLKEDSFILGIVQFLNIENNRIINEFIKFEKSLTCERDVEPYIRSKDLYLRFASHTKSKAFTFERIDDAFSKIFLFGNPDISYLRVGNSLSLPYLYHEISPPNI